MQPVPRSVGGQPEPATFLYLLRSVCPEWSPCTSSDSISTPLSLPPLLFSPAASTPSSSSITSRERKRDVSAGLKSKQEEERNGRALTGLELLSMGSLQRQTCKDSPKGNTVKLMLFCSVPSVSKTSSHRDKASLNHLPSTVIH